VGGDGTDIQPTAGWSLRCASCGARHAWAPHVHGCPTCAAEPVPAVLEAVRDAAGRPSLGSGRQGRGLARYRDLLPGTQDPAWVTLGEGGTPLLRSRWIGPGLGLENLFFKFEGSNPTGSFKDRYVAVSVNVARSFGFRRIVVSSTGNLGIAAAAYGAAAGLRTLVVAHARTPPAVLAQTEIHGAIVVKSEAADRQRLFELFAAREEWFPIGLFLRRTVQNPFGVEGYRTIAYELIEDLGRAPDVVLFPCARGNGLYGAWKGFADALAWAWIERAPRMIACQPVGADSLRVSIQRGTSAAVELPRIESLAFSAAETVASDHALAAIRRSAGTAVAADETTLREAVRELGREGLCVDPSSALPVACLRGLIASEQLDSKATVVCVLTAHGAGWTDFLPVGRAPLETLAPTSAALQAFLESHRL
jgi:threonine synthase